MSDSSPLVIRQEEGRLFEALGAPVWRLVHPKTVGSSQLGMSLCLMAPGDEIRRHSHDYEEAYYVPARRGLDVRGGRAADRPRAGCRRVRAIGSRARPGGRSRPAARHHPGAHAAAGRGRAAPLRGTLRVSASADTVALIEEKARFSRAETVRLIQIAKVGHYASSFSVRRDPRRALLRRHAAAPRRAATGPIATASSSARATPRSALYPAARRLRASSPRTCSTSTRGSATRSATIPT